MTFPALAQLLRELLVNVAEHDFALDGKEQTDSRVSLLTGIHRKEVARLRGAGTPVNETPATLSRTSAIMARWVAAPEFTERRRRAVGAAAHGGWRRAVVRDAGRPRSPRMSGRARFWTNGSTGNLVTINDEDEIVLVDAGLRCARRRRPQVALSRPQPARPHRSSGRSQRVGGRALSSSSARCIMTACRAKLAERLESRSRELAMEALKAANPKQNRALAKDKGDSAGGISASTSTAKLRQTARR